MFITMDVVLHEDTMYFSKYDFHGEHLDEIQILIYNHEEEVVEVSYQNVGDLDPSGPTLDVSGNTLYQINIEVYNVLKTRSMTELEILSVHDSLVRPMVE